MTNWIHDILDLYDNRLWSVYVALLRMKTKELVENFPEVFEEIKRIATSRFIRRSFYEFIEDSVFYQIVYQYLLSLSKEELEREGLSFEVLKSFPTGTKVKIYVTKPLLFILESALAGTYIAYRLINPFATLPLKVALAALYHDLIVHKVKKALEYLEKKQYMHAKNVLKSIVEVDLKNKFNFLIGAIDLFKILELRKVMEEEGYRISPETIRELFAVESYIAKIQNIRIGEDFLYLNMYNALTELKEHFENKEKEEKKEEKQEEVISSSQTESKEGYQ